MASGKPQSKALVAGVDGCPSGWVTVVAELPSKTSKTQSLKVQSISVVSTEELIEATSRCEAVSIDMPVGFAEHGAREADIHARRFIGPRRSSVFPAPPRALLTADGDFWALNALSRSIDKGLSRQTYNLLPRMRELDAVMTPELQCQVRETHPEVSFCALKGECLRYPKRSREGRQERLELLSRVYGEGVHDWRPPSGARFDDLYDAAVLTWSAARVVRGEARTLPPEPPVDARGLRMEIVY